MAGVKNKGLGRGLGSLIADATDEMAMGDSVKVIEVDINKIEPNKAQPRRNFDENSLIELAESIKELGVIQPLTVIKKDSGYEIVAGERRWRAARIAQLKTVPVIVKSYSDIEKLEVALVENIQRENLNPLEEAITYKRFADEFGLNQEAIANKVGKSRAVVANAMRLLNLDGRVQTFVKEGKLSNGHARALLAINDGEVQFELAEKIIDDQISVRETEELVKIANEPIEEDEAKKARVKNPEEARAYLALAKDLKTIFGTKVNIKNGKKKGRIEIEYYSDDELDRIVGLIKKMQ